MPSWKILTGRTLAFYAANESTEDSINASIQRHLAMGWTLQGPMIRAHNSTEIWIQRVVKLPLPRI